jgi:hypothetical protein
MNSNAIPDTRPPSSRRTVIAIGAVVAALVLVIIVILSLRDDRTNAQAPGTNPADTGAGNTPSTPVGGNR